VAGGTEAMARIKSKESTTASQVTAAAKQQPVTLTTPNGHAAALTEPPPDSPPRDWAPYYAQKYGWRLLPVHYALAPDRRDGHQCSCHDPHCKDIGKHPASANGKNDATTDPERIRWWWATNKYFNIGLLNGQDGLIVVDVDTGLDKDGKPKRGDETLAALIERNSPLPETLRARSGGGGTHYYFFSTQPCKMGQNTLGLHIDTPSYVLLPPSSHKSGGHYKWINPGCAIAELPAWMAALLKPKPLPDPTAEDLKSLNDLKEEDQEKSKKKISKRTLRKLVSVKPDGTAKYVPSDDRTEWRDIGMALKKEFGEEEGWDLWETWSKTSSKYDPKVQLAQWRTFDPTRAGCPNGGTIWNIATEKHGFISFDATAANEPELVENWIWVNGIKRFVDVKRNFERDRDQMNAMLAPLFDKGKASDHILSNSSFPRVEGATYWPGQDRRVEEINGMECWNYWQPVNITPSSGSVQLFLDHISYLLPRPEESNILLDYLTFQVKYPGEKVHWAILLSGKQGTGNSYLAAVMQGVLGPHNVKILNNEQLHEPFTGWQKNTQFIVVEEIMAGDRKETMNKLKPMITEPWCSIREMYKPPYDQPNRFNFLFLTNQPDALLINKTDRRYCILACEAEPRDVAYYAKLFAWTRENAPALLHYFQNHPLENFQAKAHAPSTDAKRAMIREGMKPLPRTILELIEAEQWPFDVDLVNPNLLAEDLLKMNHRANPTEIGMVLKDLDMLNLGRLRVDIKGKEQMVMTMLWAVRNFDDYKDLDNYQIRKIVSVQRKEQEERIHQTNKKHKAEGQEDIANYRDSNRGDRRAM
jgi:hypothetical protein